MKKLFLSTLLLMIVLVGCSKDNIEERVYNKIFKNIEEIIIFTALDGPNISFQKQDVNLIERDIKKLQFTKEYVADAAPFGEFKEGYKTLFLFVKNSSGIKKRYILYSIENKSIIVRKKDVFKVEKEDPHKITVYELGVPTTVINIIKKYEDKLGDPNEIIFYSSWPFDW